MPFELITEIKFLMEIVSGDITVFFFLLVILRLLNLIMIALNDPRD